MSDICDLSELPVDQCACRIHAPAEPAGSASVAYRFRANFTSRCDYCDKRIESGDDMAKMDDDSYVCEGCAP